MKKITFIIIFIILLIGLFAFVGNNNESSDTVINTDRDSNATTINDLKNLGEMPSFSLANYEGEIVSSKDFTDKILIVNSWATWCPFCVNELPDFAEAQERLGDEFVFIAINRQESMEKAKGFTDKLGITDDMLFLMDDSDNFYKSIGGFSMPETLFVDKNGDIRIHKRGPMALDEVLERANSLLITNN